MNKDGKIGVFVNMDNFANMDNFGTETFLKSENDVPLGTNIFHSGTEQPR